MKLITASLLTALVGVGVYLNTLSHELVFDDIPAIPFNKDLRPHSPWTNLLYHDFWGTPLENPLSHKSYRPLCVATFRLNYLLHELEPMGYHLVNILLHGVVCYLYVQLCGLVLSEVWPALIAGLLFAVHPIHTEAVAGVVGRAELLCGVLYLLSILCYQRSLHKQAGVSVWWFGASMVSSVLALLSKEQGVTALGACLALDFFVLHKVDLLSLLQPTFSTPPSSPLTKHFPAHTLTKPQAMRPFFLRGIAVGVVGFISIATRIIVSNGTPQAMFQDRNINPPLFQEWPWSAFSWLHLVFVNLWVCLCPSPLSADWRFGAVPLTHSLTDTQNILTLITLLSLAALTTFALSGRGGGARVTLFALSLMVFPYLPASNLFFPVGFVVAERVLYLPSMGLCLLVAHGLWRVMKQFRASRILHSLMVGLTLCLLVTHTIKTMRRNKDWADNLSLCQAGVRVNPRNALLISNAGLEYVWRGDHSMAVRYYQAAMTLNPNYTGSYYNYGKLLTRSRQYGKAEEFLRTALSLAETTGSEFGRIPEMYHLLIETLLSQPSRLHEAHTLVDHALSQHPSHAPLHTDKCVVLNQLNRTHQAVKWCKNALNFNPSDSRAQRQLGVAYMHMGNSDESEDALRSLLAVAPGNTNALFQLASLCQSKGRLEEAAQLWQELLTFDPNNVDVLLRLAQVQDSLSGMRVAIATINKALRIDPSHRQVLYLGAQLLYRHGNLSEASRVLRRLYSIDRGYRDVGLMLARVDRELGHAPAG